jgi:hypothetical protein
LSDIRANTISDAAGTGPIDLYKQSAAKAWCHFTQASAAIQDSFNASSLTDSSVGRTYGSITRAMSNNTYPVSFSQWDAVYFLAVSVGSAKTATSFFIICGTVASVDNDADQVTYTIHGDLA